MSRGQKDYGQYAVKEVTASLSDMGEVAARLGSIVTFDKRGDVIDFDNFEEPLLKWDTYATGSATWPYLYSEDAKSGSQSILLNSGAIAGDYVRIRKGYSVLASKKLGIEISFGCDYGNDYLYLRLTYFDDTNGYITEVKLDLKNNKAYILDEDDNYTEIGVIDVRTKRDFLYYSMKLVVDFDTLKYIRFLFANTEFDLSAYSLRTEATGGQPRVETLIKTEHISGADSKVRVDDVIWTQAEP